MFKIPSLLDEIVLHHYPLPSVSIINVYGPAFNKKNEPLSYGPPYFLNWSLFFIYSKESQELYEELKEEMKNLTMPTFVYNSLLHVYGFHGKVNIFTLICINYNSDGKLSIAIW